MKSHTGRDWSPAGNTEISVAPDGSAVFARNIGTQEIYSLTEVAVRSSGVVDHPGEELTD